MGASNGGIAIKIDTSQIDIEKVVQDLLGHESITTTELYTHLDTAYLRETIMMFHPRNKQRRKEFEE